MFGDDLFQVFVLGALGAMSKTTDNLVLHRAFLLDAGAE
jgi:hypothetical protein